MHQNLLLSYTVTIFHEVMTYFLKFPSFLAAMFTGIFVLSTYISKSTISNSKIYKHEPEINLFNNKKAKLKQHIF